MFSATKTTFFAVFVYAILAVASALPNGNGGQPPYRPTTITYTQPGPTPTTITVTNPPITTTVTVVPPPATTTVATGGGQCNTGPIQCCNSVQSASSSGVGLLLGLLGIVLNDLSVLVGVTCSPLSVIGVGGNSCTAQPVCCQNNNFNGVIAIGCTPININL